MRDIIVAHNGHKITSESQRRCYRFVARAGWEGATVAEVREAAAKHGYHHGNISGPLSILHGFKALALLQEKRGGNHIYVLPEHVDGRPTRPKKRRSHCPGCRCES